MKTLIAGDSMPSFSLFDQYGEIFSSIAFKGRKLVIFFYPKDESAVCTKEACTFRDSFIEFSDEGAVVIGINSGTVQSHINFSSKNKLPYYLLSDPGNKVLKQFGIKDVLFMTGRETFLVGQDGKIEFTYRAFLSGDAHSKKMLEFLRTN
ncbi:peroxiredoxin [Pedobacter sp. L105]|uniref:peroxiredoxin n=1 Tax=Pedobacter sp. L105 TaxID=1641871 RepID=UPI001C2015EC|nr:peroxiredoxin [Pedobacter sp. L105]